MSGRNHRGVWSSDTSPAGDCQVAALCGNQTGMRGVLHGLCRPLTVLTRSLAGEGAHGLGTLTRDTCGWLCDVCRRGSPCAWREAPRSPPPENRGSTLTVDKHIRQVSLSLSSLGQPDLRVLQVHNHLRTCCVRCARTISPIRSSVVWERSPRDCQYTAAHAYRYHMCRTSRKNDFFFFEIGHLGV